MDIEATLCPIDGDGSRGFILLGRDVTERKRAATALLDRERRLKAVMDNVADGLITIDENGLIVALNQPGELWVRGYNVMLGYWDDGEQGRWMHTGDIATMDEAGYVRIVGRSKDMLIRGGVVQSLDAKGL